MSQHQQLNFLLTNRIPRRLLTQLFGWYSKIESPFLARISIAVWRTFAQDMNLDEAKSTSFSSVHDCFIRQLKENARPIDPRDDSFISPCDGIVVACGTVAGTTVFQAKGFPYDIGDLLPATGLSARFRDGKYITLRLKSSMYHRFHAPVDGAVTRIHRFSGDVWNVNPIALSRIENLYCKNERACIEYNFHGYQVAIIPVAAILVASLRLHCLTAPLNYGYQGPKVIDIKADYKKGEELGYFEHGSTIILFLPPKLTITDNVKTGTQIRMGEAIASFKPNLVDLIHQL